MYINQRKTNLRYHYSPDGHIETLGYIISGLCSAVACCYIVTLSSSCVLTVVPYFSPIISCFLLSPYPQHFRRLTHIPIIFLQSHQNTTNSSLETIPKALLTAWQFIRWICAVTQITNNYVQKILYSIDLFRIVVTGHQILWSKL